MSNVLGKLVGNSEQTQKQLGSIEGTVNKIYAVQVEAARAAKIAEQRRAQSEKRKAADNPLKNLFAKQDKDNKKKDGFWSKLLKLLGPLAGLVGTLGRGLGSVINNAIGKPMGIVLRETLAAAARTLFGKDGVFAKLWDGAFGKKGWARKGWNKAFGKEGWAAKAWGKAFGKGGWASKAFKGVSQTGAGKGITKALQPITTFFSSLAAGGGIQKVLSNVIGKTALGKMVRGAGLGAIIEGVTTYQETGDAGQGLAAGGGAFAGGLAGAKLGGIIGTAIAPGIGTAIGAFLGGVGGTIIGSELGQSVFKAITENPAFIAISDWYKGYLEGLFGSFMETWNAFTEMVDVLWRSLQRFYEEAIQPFFDAIGNFFKNTWNAVVDGVQSFFENVQSLTSAIGDFISGVWDNFIGQIEAVADFFGLDLTPIMEAFGAAVDAVIQPFEWLKEKAIDPLIEAVQNLLGVFGEFPSGEEVGKAVGDFVFGGPKKFFEFVTGGLSDYADGRQEGGVIGRQTGGLIPTMLEPGEAVFGPGSWGSSVAAANSMFPRFQTGGIVPGTGTGDIYGPVGLAPGSFVLNRNATSMLGLQNGGVVDPEQLAEGQEANASTPTPSGSKVLDVPYYNQRQNKVDGMGRGGDTQCFSTAAAMVVSAVQGKNITPDEYNKVRVKYGDSTSMSAQTQAMGAFGVPSSGGDNASYSSYKASINAGKPVILGLQHNNRGGHMVTGIGYNKEGIVVNDPYGKLNPTPKGGWAQVNVSGKGDTKGAAVTYPKSLMDGIWMDRGPGTGRNVTPSKGGVKAGVGTLGDSDSTGTAGTTAAASAAQSSIDSLKSSLSGLGEAGAGASAVLTAIQEVFAQDAEGKALLQAMGLSVTPAADAAAASSSSTATGGSGYSGKDGASVSDPNSKALLNAIADAEGTSQYANNGYNTMFTGKQFEDLSKHPRAVQRSSGYSSDAAGRYQFLSTTWDEMGQPDMSPKSQDKAALKLLSQTGVDLSDGLSMKEIYKVGQKWASVEGGPEAKPGGSYGSQAKYSAKEFAEMYQKYGGKMEGMQTGGVVNMSRATSTTSARFKQAQDKFAANFKGGGQPIVIPMPMPAPQMAPPTIRSNPGSQTNAPNLPDGPSSVQSAEYFYRLSMGSVF